MKFLDPLRLTLADVLRRGSPFFNVMTNSSGFQSPGSATVTFSMVNSISVRNVNRQEYVA